MNHQNDLEERLRQLAPKTSSEYQTRFTQRFKNALEKEEPSRKISRLPLWPLAAAASIIAGIFILNLTQTTNKAPSEIATQKELNHDAIEEKPFIPRSFDAPIVLGDNGKIYRVFKSNETSDETKLKRRLIAVNSF